MYVCSYYALLVTSQFSSCPPNKRRGGSNSLQEYRNYSGCSPREPLAGIPARSRKWFPGNAVCDQRATLDSSRFSNSKDQHRVRGTCSNRIEWNDTACNSCRAEEKRHQALLNTRWTVGLLFQHAALTIDSVNQTALVSCLNGLRQPRTTADEAEQPSSDSKFTHNFAASAGAESSPNASVDILGYRTTRTIHQCHLYDAGMVTA